MKKYCTAKVNDYPLCISGKISDFIAEANPAFLGSLATLAGRKTKLSTANIRDWKTLEPGINRILRAQGNRSQPVKVVNGEQAPIVYPI